MTAIEDFKKEILKSYPNYEIIYNLLYPKESIELAIKNNDQLLEQVDDSGSTFLHIACQNINIIEIELLIKVNSLNPGAIRKKNKFGLLPIHKAVTAISKRDGTLSGFSNINSIKYILELFPEGLLYPNIEGLLPIHLALSNPKYISQPLIELLVNICPESLTVQDKYGHYAIHKAASKRYISTEVMEIITSKSPETVSLKDNNGYLPLHWSLSTDYPNLEVIYHLIEVYPEGLTQLDNEGNTPYMKLMQRSKRNKEIDQLVSDLTDVNIIAVRNKKKIKTIK